MKSAENVYHIYKKEAKKQLFPARILAYFEYLPNKIQQQNVKKGEFYDEKNDKMQARINILVHLFGDFCSFLQLFGAIE